MADDQHRIRFAVALGLTLVVLLVVSSSIYILFFAPRQPRAVRVLEEAGHELEIHPLSDFGSEPQEDQDIGGIQISEGDELQSLANLAADMRYLEHITVGPGRYSDGQPLQAFANQLTGLSLRNCPIAELSFLSKMTHLDSLFLYSIEAKSIPPLASLKELKYVHLEKVPISDLSCLTKLKVEYLNLVSTEVSDISALATLSKLESFSIEDHRYAVDLAPLANVTSLRSIHVSRVPLQRADWLSSCGQIFRIDIRAVPLQQFPNIKKSQARDLTLAETGIRDLRSLSGLDLLEVLDLTDTPVDDITPLADLPKLKDLVLKRTQVTDITPLSNAKELVELNIAQTNVRDVMPLTKAPRLRYLRVSINQFPAAQLQKFRSIRKDCEIYYD